MQLTAEQIERESSFRIALNVMKTLRHRGMLNESEFKRARKRLIEKYKPVWGHYPDLIEDYG